MLLFLGKHIYGALSMEHSSSHVVSPLEAHLGYWLRYISNHVSASFAKALHARQFTVAEWVVLRHLYDHPEIASIELAAFLGMTRGATSKVLDKLEAKGLVERIARLEDKRSHRLSLTSDGTSILPILAGLADHNDAYFFDCLSDTEQATLRQLLQKVAQQHQWSDVPVD